MNNDKIGKCDLIVIRWNENYTFKDMVEVDEGISLIKRQFPNNKVIFLNADFDFFESNGNKESHIRTTPIIIINKLTVQSLTIQILSKRKQSLDEIYDLLQNYERCFNSNTKHRKCTLQFIQNNKEVKFKKQIIQEYDQNGKHLRQLTKFIEL